MGKRRSKTTHDWATFERNVRSFASDLMHAKRALSPEMVSRLGEYMKNTLESWYALKRVSRIGCKVFGKKDVSVSNAISRSLEQNNEYRKRVERFIGEDMRIRYWQRFKRLVGLQSRSPNEMISVGMYLCHYYDNSCYMLNVNAYTDFFNYEGGASYAYGVLNIEPDYSDVKEGYWGDRDVDYLKLGELVAEWESEHPRVGIFFRYRSYYVVRGESQRAISNALRDLKQQLNDSEHKTVTSSYRAPVVFRFNVRYGIGGTVEEADSVCFNHPLRGSMSLAPARSQLVTETQGVQGLPTGITKPVHERHTSLGSGPLEIVKATLAILGGLLVSVGVLFCCLVIGALFIFGGAWVSSKLLPWFVVASSVAFVLVIFAFLPLAIPRATRGASIIGLIISSWVFGITLWMEGLLLSLSIWGIAGVIIGLGIVGVGVVPIAMLATLIHGMWRPLMELVLLTIMTLGTGVGAALLAGTRSG